MPFFPELLTDLIVHVHRDVLSVMYFFFSEELHIYIVNLFRRGKFLKLCSVVEFD